MSKKSNYWVQRAIEQERLKDEIARDYIERTEKQLREYERELKREIEAFYARYAIDHKMTQKEAMKYLRDDERKEFQEATLEKFREMALDPNADQALLDALSYRHRISRKEVLLAEIQSKTAQLYAKPGGLKDTAEQALSDVYVRGKVETAKMFAKAGIIAEPKLDKHMIKERMNFKWTDKHFSERIWGQNRRTYEAIATVLNNGFTGGWSLDRIKKELSAKIKGVPLHRMDTLIKTEATAFNTLAMKDMLIELDTKKYSIVAVIDSRTSEICSHQNEKIYDMDKLEIGVTAPPFHPRCRSTIAPVEDEDDFDYFQEPEDRKANGKRTLDEILADWEKKAEELINPEAFKKGFNTYEDPIREIMGSAFNSHPFETIKILDELKETGIDVIYSDKPGMLYQPRPGRPGQIRLDKESSFSALLHEYTHAMDDRESGWKGAEYLYDDIKAIEFEIRAYDVELDFYRLNNVDEQYIIRLEKLKQAEIKRIESRWDEWQE